MPPAAKRKTGARPPTKRKGPMLTFLFRRLTASPRRGAELFDAVTGLAREPHWYVEGKVPDTLDGRFAVLATLTALVLVRLEGEGESGNAISVALTERFLHVMESEHRELGIGDPTLGKTMRKLVGSLARRVELWRSATSGDVEWQTATRDSLYKGGVSADAMDHAGGALKHLWSKLQGTALAEIDEGKLQ
jgi:cytochrome b pre-mRNA-processing protein 3